MNRRMRDRTYGGVRGRGLAAPSYSMGRGLTRWLRRSAGAPMGPPTISAEQPGSGSGGRLGLLRFNGAADDLGGTTKSCSAIQNKIFKLQWGRRRSRRNNAVMWATISCASPASMGPPTISAEQRFLSCLSATVHKRCFNGAADDLGGTTLYVE